MVELGSYRDHGTQKGYSAAVLGDLLHLLRRLAAETLPRNVSLIMNYYCACITYISANPSSVSDESLQGITVDIRGTRISLWAPIYIFIAPCYSGEELYCSIHLWNLIFKLHN